MRMRPAHTHSSSQPTYTMPSYSLCTRLMAACRRFWTVECRACLCPLAQHNTEATVDASDVLLVMAHAKRARGTSRRTQQCTASASPLRPPPPAILRTPALRYVSFSLQSTRSSHVDTTLSSAPLAVHHCSPPSPTSIVAATLLHRRSDSPADSTSWSGSSARLSTILPPRT